MKQFYKAIYSLICVKSEVTQEKLQSINSYKFINVINVANLLMLLMSQIA